MISTHPSSVITCKDKQQQEKQEGSKPPEFIPRCIQADTGRAVETQGRWETTVYFKEAKFPLQEISMVLLGDTGILSKPVRSY